MENFGDILYPLVSDSHFNSVYSVMEKAANYAFEINNMNQLNKCKVSTATVPSVFPAVVGGPAFSVSQQH